METPTSDPYLGDLGSPWCSYEVLGWRRYWRRRHLGSAAALTAQLGRYAPGQVANARTCTGKAQLSGHIQEEVASATSPVCGGLSHP